MDVYRLTRAKRVDEALTGIGARLVGQRWNRKGTAVVYTSESLELAVLESLVHVDLDEVPTDQVCIRFTVPGDAIATASLADLPAGWDAPGPYQPRVQAYGDQWVAGGTSLALALPATVLPMRRNVLINPAHARLLEVLRVEVLDFTWPERLLAALGA